MARTTIDLDRSVLEELRRRSELESKSMGQLASELLAGALANAEDSGDRGPGFTVRTARLGKPRVDLEDKEAVSRALDRDPR